MFYKNSCTGSDKGFDKPCTLVQSATSSVKEQLGTKKRTGRVIPSLNTPSAIHCFQPRGFPDPHMVCLVENSQGISLTQFPLKAI